MRFFEDISLGEQITLGTHTFTEEAIIRFAQKFDPQFFHLDADAAKDSLYGGLIASGWHTASIWMRLMVDYQRNIVTNLKEAGITPGQFGPSPGFTDMSWNAPVYSGDTLTYTTRVLEKIESKSRPEWGILKHYNEGIKENGKIAFKFTGTVFCKRRT